MINIILKPLAFIFVCLCLLCMNCSGSAAVVNAEESNYNECIDSAAYYFQQGMLTHDTISINKALVLLENIIKEDTVKSELKNCYQLQTQIYLEQKMYKEAYSSMMAYIEILPQDNLQRLIFLGIVNKHKGEIEESEKNFNRALVLCDSILQKGDSLTAEYNKADVIYYKLGGAKALEYIKSNSVISKSESDLDAFIDQWNMIHAQMDSLFENVNLADGK